MKTLEIMDAGRQVLATIIWNTPGNLTIDAEDNDIKKELDAWLEDLKRDGIPTLADGVVEDIGQAYFIQEVQIVTLRDKHFLAALQETLYRYSLKSQSIFGILKEN